MINENEIQILQRGLEILEADQSDLPAFTPQFDVAAVTDVIETVATRMQDNYPYYHPQYAGQMLKPPHPVARIAYALSLWINPNNHALDGSRASSPMEKECIADLGRLFGWDAPLGHLTGGGTMANLEALWVAGKLHPGKRIVGSSQAHYTHSRISEVLGLPYTAVGIDDSGRMDLDSLDALLADGDVGTVVATIGNTGLGSVDPLADILNLQQRYGFRVHADAAYGGYFGLATALQDDTRRAYDALSEVDSIVVDPHKHGLQPYGCGCILYRDPAVGQIYQHESPYTYFSSDELHLGEISLECSRAGASAVALWATHQLLPPVHGGVFGDDLNNCLLAARDFHRRLAASELFTPLVWPDLDIVCYLVNGDTTALASQRAQQTFDNAAARELHLALIDLPSEWVQHYVPTLEINTPTTKCLRSVLMKPEQREWTERLVALLEDCVRTIDAG